MLELSRFEPSAVVVVGLTVVDAEVAAGNVTEALLLPRVVCGVAI
jgi:hypothetical protein